MTLLPKYSVLAILLSLVGACTSAVSYDYDTEYAFSQLQSFTVGAARASEDLIAKRLNSLISDDLTTKNFSRNDQRADFRVIHALADGMHQTKEQPIVSVGASAGSWKPRLGVGVSVPIGGNKISYVLKISITTSAGQLVWQGQDTVKLNGGGDPDEKSAALSSTVTKILSKFPPR
jgi:hypothetical protein|tara:strand:- start:4147 stop:4674 length:528 start_codon:yes stop_codon:yes gene_type:complete